MFLSPIAFDTLLTIVFERFMKLSAIGESELPIGEVRLSDCPCLLYSASRLKALGLNW